jgi:hypothetical protein
MDCSMSHLPEFLTLDQCSAFNSFSVTTLGRRVKDGRRSMASMRPSRPIGPGSLHRPVAIRQRGQSKKRKTFSSTSDSLAASFTKDVDCRRRVAFGSRP